MATATLRKSLSSPGTQRAIAAKAKKIASEKIAAARERFRKAAPALKKDVLEAFIIPTGYGVAGAMAGDFVLDRFQVLGGAKGDISKILAALAIGTAGRKYLKGVRGVHEAAIGMLIVNTYKLGTRLVNRGTAGVPLSGLLDDNSNADLTGYWGNTTVLNGLGRLDAVNLQLADGSVVPGYQDDAGNLYDEEGALIVLEDEQMSGLPSEAIPQITSRVQLASGNFVN